MFAAFERKLTELLVFRGAVEERDQEPVFEKNQTGGIRNSDS